MKISNASKKVLASALSAAMVVAFAPTVAFGAQKTPITIDLDGGVVETGSTSFPEAEATTSITLPTANKDGYAIDHFWWDNDANGVVAEDGSEDIEADKAFTATGATGAVTLKAIYKTPKVSGIELNVGSAKVTQVAAGTDTNLVIDVDQFVSGMNTIAKKNSNYTLTVKKGADTLKSWEYVATAAAGETDKYVTVADDDANHTLKFQYNPTSSDADAVLLSNLTSGKYTVELADDKGVVSTKEIELVKVTFKPATGDAVSYLYDKEVGFNLSGITGTYLTEDGYAFGTEVSKGLSGDVTVTQSTATSSVDGASYTNGLVKFTVKDSEATNDKDSFAISVTDAAGDKVWSATVKGDAIDSTTGKEFKFTFDANSADVQKAAKAQAAGAYTVTVVKTPEFGEVSTVKAKIFTLTEFKYVAGEGTEFGTDFKTADKQDVFVTDATKNYSTFAFATAKDDFENVKYLLNGKEINSVSNPVAVGGVNEITAVATAKDTSDTVAKPAIASATRELQKGSKTLYDYTVKLSSATAGATLVYTTDASDVDTDGEIKDTAKTKQYNAATGIKMSDLASANTTGAIWVKAVKTTGATASTITKDSATVKFVLNSDAVDYASYTAGGTSQLEAYVGVSTTKWLAADGVKAAIESGKASVDALGYYVVEGDKEGAKVVKAAYKSLYEAIDAAANAYLAKFENGAYVVEGSKVYTMTAANLKAAKTAVAKIENDVKKAEAAKTEDSATYKGAIFTAAGTGPAAPASGLLSVVDNATIYTEDKTVAAADITAAKTVTEQLKAAKTGDEAKAAIEAYSKLTDAQKKLVASADVAAVQEIVTKAALVDAQDLAAARDLNGKKVTAKAKVGKKATGKSFTYKLAASESGATATYKKVSGSKYIKVSKSGKVSFKAVKVQKKAKTYSAKVSVTYGTQTVTKTVKLVVKKK